MTDLNPIIDTLADNLGQLHTADGHQLNLVPFQIDDAEGLAKQLRHDIAEGIVLVLDQHGYINRPQPTESAVPQSIVTLTCGQCSGELLTVNLAGPLNGRNIISHMGQRDPECRTRHAVLTPDQIRLRILEHIDAEADNADV